MKALSQPIGLFHFWTMKFIDEAKIEVHAGKGGDGMAHFHRAKYIRRGGPDGGDGGRGGSIWARADRNLNTLIDYRFARIHRAAAGTRGGTSNCNGAAGKDVELRMPVGTVIRDEESADLVADLAKDGERALLARGGTSNCAGAAGKDVELRMPVGTVIRDEESADLVADLAKDGERALLARGGQGGLGNVHFKSSVNRAPRQFTRGAPGESRRLQLELRVLADAGLLGAPNAGKSSFIRAVSSARPKVADYPFTTLNPSLGVVRVGEQSFVIADIPGLIEGAAEGAGLGHQFLRHLGRTRVLLHLVDLTDEHAARTARAIAAELKKYDPALHRKPRWLIFNKIDAVPDARARAERIVRSLRWQRPWFSVSALTGEGCAAVCKAVARELAR